MSATYHHHIFLRTATASTSPWYSLSWTDDTNNRPRTIYISGANVQIQATPDPMLVNGKSVSPSNSAVIASTSVTGPVMLQLEGPYCGIRAVCAASATVIGLV